MFNTNSNRLSFVVLMRLSVCLHEQFNRYNRVSNSHAFSATLTLTVHVTQYTSNRSSHNMFYVGPAICNRLLAITLLNQLINIQRSCARTQKEDVLDRMAVGAEASTLFQYASELRRRRAHTMRNGSIVIYNSERTDGWFSQSGQIGLAIQLLQIVGDSLGRTPR